MGLYQLPRGYDDWRLTPPEDRRPCRPGPSTVEKVLSIETPDATLDAWATYSATDGRLICARINGRERAPEEIAAFFNPDALGTELDALPMDDVDCLAAAAMADEEADRADDEYHRRRDYGED